MNIGDLVIQRSLLGFKGILLNMVYEIDSEIDEVQLSLYNPDPERYWKVLWFQKNFYEPPSIEVVRERDMFKLERKRKNGL
jgi:hypothetical protein|tara:strand:+ start:1178 stop:1420 length:243 start_codon:yes stop_codon:yes gene_type:complete